MGLLKYGIKISGINRATAVESPSLRLRLQPTRSSPWANNALSFLFDTIAFWTIANTHTHSLSLCRRPDNAPADTPAHAFVEFLDIDASGKCPSIDTALMLTNTTLGGKNLNIQRATTPGIPPLPDKASQAAPQAGGNMFLTVYFLLDSKCGLLVFFFPPFPLSAWSSHDDAWRSLYANDAAWNAFYACYGAWWYPLYAACSDWFGCRC